MTGDLLVPPPVGADVIASATSSTSPTVKAATSAHTLAALASSTVVFLEIKISNIKLKR